MIYIHLTPSVYTKLFYYFNNLKLHLSLTYFIFCTKLAQFLSSQIKELSLNLKVIISVKVCQCLT